MAFRNARRRTYPHFHTYAWGIQNPGSHLLPAPAFNVDDRDSFGMPTTTMPTGFTPAERIVKVGSSNLKDVVVLWPSFRAERGRTAVYRFVTMS